MDMILLLDQDLWMKRSILVCELNRKPEPDTLAFQIKKGYKAKEVQVKMEDRLAGTSIYTGIGSSIQYMLKVLITIIFFN